MPRPVIISLCVWGGSKNTYIVDEPDERYCKQPPPVIAKHKSVWDSDILHALAVSCQCPHQFSAIGVDLRLGSFWLMQLSTAHHEDNRRYYP